MGQVVEGRPATKARAGRPVNMIDLDYRGRCGQMPVTLQHWAMGGSWGKWEHGQSPVAGERKEEGSLNL